MAEPGRLIVRRRRRDTALQALLHDPECWLASGRHLKHDGRTAIAAVRIGGSKLVIKRRRLRGPLEMLRAGLGRSRALRAWNNAARLAARGIATARPVAVVERRFGPFVSACYYLSEYVEGARCREFFALETAGRDQAAAVEAIVELFRALARHRISHGDMKDTNIILCAARPVLIDIETVRLHRSAPMFRRAFARDVGRFLMNWEDRPALRRTFEARLARLGAEAG